MSRNRILSAAAAAPLAAIALGATASTGPDRPAVYVAMVVAALVLLAALLFAFWCIGWFGGRMEAPRRRHFDGW